MVPPLPSFIFGILAFIIEYLHMMILHLRRAPPPPLPLNALLAGIENFMNIVSRMLVPIHVIIRNHYDGNRWLLPAVRRNIWNTLVINPESFWFLTGETPGSLFRVVQRIGAEVEARVRDPWNPRMRMRRTRPYALCLHDRVLLTFIWLRQYHTLTALGQLFGVSVSNVYDTLLTVVPILHEHYFWRYIAWNDENQWNNQRHEFDELPNAVGAIDAFAVQINRPQGAAQRLYYRRDRGYHFLNFHVIIDNDGFFQFSRGGFLGHANNAASYARLPAMEYG